jgi:hypothetical protein
LAAELARGRGKMQRELGRSVKRRLQWLRGLLAKRRSDSVQDEEAVGVLACMVGGLTLARAVGGISPDSTLSLPLDVQQLIAAMAHANATWGEERIGARSCAQARLLRIVAVGATLHATRWATARSRVEIEGQKPLPRGRLREKRYRFGVHGGRRFRRLEAEGQILSDHGETESAPVGQVPPA